MKMWATQDPEGNYTQIFPSRSLARKNRWNGERVVRVRITRVT